MFKNFVGITPDLPILHRVVGRVLTRRFFSQVLIFKEEH